MSYELIANQFMEKAQPATPKKKPKSSQKQRQANFRLISK